MKSGIDTDALMRQMAEASARQGEAVRKAVQEATLQALQGRELSLKSIRDVLKTVTLAVSAGAQQNTATADMEALLGKAVAGMDAAVLKAVEANRRALEQLVAQGVDQQDKAFKRALADIEKMEDALFVAIDKAAGDGGAALRAQWGQALQAFRQEGSATGDAALKAVEQLGAQSRAAVRDGRVFGQRAARTLLDHYAALASGVLIGMSSAMAGPAASPAAAAPAAAPRRRAKA